MARRYKDICGVLEGAGARMCYRAHTSLGNCVGNCVGSCIGNAVGNRFWTMGEAVFAARLGSNPATSTVRIIGEQRYIRWRGNGQSTRS